MLSRAIWPWKPGSRGHEPWDFGDRAVAKAIDRWKMKVRTHVSSGQQCSLFTFSPTDFSGYDVAGIDVGMVRSNLYWTFGGTIKALCVKWDTVF